ncbi:MAG: hypothetical protein HY764_00015 [Candidatus Portnoybacteria bacterium]|nr:hypothetical protein [Candidatus Portnoybacteria bacterium]
MGLAKIKKHPIIEKGELPPQTIAMNKNGAKTKEFIKKLQSSKDCCPRLSGEALEKCLKKMDDCRLFFEPSKNKTKR